MAERLPAAVPPPVKIRVSRRFVQDAEPVAGRRFGIRAVGPEFGQYPGEVAAQDRLRLVWHARRGVEGMAGADVAALDLVVEVVGKIGIGVEVADAARADVDRDAVFDVELGLPAGDEGKTVLPVVQTLVRLTQQRRRAGVEVHGVGAPVSLEVIRIARLEGKRGDVAPVGPAERHNVLEGLVAGLVHEAATEGEGLPAVGIFKRETAQALFRDVERIVDRFVTGVGVVALLVGAVREVSSIDGLRHAVPVGRSFRGVEQIVGDGAGGGDECIDQQPKGFAPVRRSGIPQGNESEGVGGHHVPVSGRARQPGANPVGCIRPSDRGIDGRAVQAFGQQLQCVLAGAEVVQVAGVDVGAGEVVADGLEQDFVPRLDGGFIRLTPNGC